LELGVLKIISIVIFSIFFALSVSAKEPPGAMERLAALYSEIESQNESLIKVNKSMKQVELELIRLGKEQRTLQGEETRLKNDLAKLFKAWELCNKKISEIDAEISEIRDRSLERIRNIYMSQNDQVKSHLISTGKYENISELLFLLSRIDTFDKNLVVKLRGLVKAQREEEARYQRLMTEQQEVKAKVMAKASEIQNNLDATKSMKKKLQEEEGAVEGVLVKLRGNALRLETVVASLTEADIEPSQDNKDRSLTEARARLNPKFIPFDGPGLKPKQISRPVNGRVVRSFGRFHHAEFNDLIFNKGVLFLAPASAPIKAAARGQVVYVGKMPGYGSMIILDHGNRSHSLYAKLNEPRVQPKQLVEKGEVVALTGDVAADKGNFYFEIRKAGKPVNPADFLP
jgi:septal ring factor EnvC (AmiA/AmiB activator)